MRLSNWDRQGKIQWRLDGWQTSNNLSCFEGRSRPRGLQSGPHCFLCVGKIMMPNHEQKIVWLTSLRISAFIAVAVVVRSFEIWIGPDRKKCNTAKREQMIWTAFVHFCLLLVPRFKMSDYVLRLPTFRYLTLTWRQRSVKIETVSFQWILPKVIVDKNVNLAPVRPVKSRQMSMQVAQKWFH